MLFPLRFLPTLEMPKRAKQGCESTVSQGSATAPRLAVLWDHCSQILKSSMLERITTTLTVMGLGGNWLFNFFSGFVFWPFYSKYFLVIAWQVAVLTYVAVSKKSPSNLLFSCSLIVCHLPRTLPRLNGLKHNFFLIGS